MLQSPCLPRLSLSGSARNLQSCLWHQIHLAKNRGPMHVAPRSHAGCRPVGLTTPQLPHMYVVCMPISWGLVKMWVLSLPLKDRLKFCITNHPQVLLTLLAEIIWVANLLLPVCVTGEHTAHQKQLPKSSYVRLFIFT